MGLDRRREHYEFWIKDPKPRLIQTPYLEDRIVQHAVCNALRVPIQERMIAHTYSCLIGRGTHACSRQLQRYLKNRRWRYYLSLDISKFFYSINHDSLYAELQRHIKCLRTLELLWRFITVNGTGKGIPIGASTSQIMANMALNPLDHFARRDLKLSTYLRYCDDMVALFETAAEAHAALEAIRSKVADLDRLPSSCPGVVLAWSGLGDDLGFVRFSWGSPVPTAGFGVGGVSTRAIRVWFSFYHRDNEHASLAVERVPIPCAHG